MAWTRGRKILVGCLVAVAVVVVAVIVVLALFVSWLRTPGEELEGNRLLAADTQVFLEVTLPEDNPGSRDLVRALVKANQRLTTNLEGAPPFMSLLLGSVPQQQVSDEDIDEFLPLTAILTRDSGDPEAEGAPIFVINLPALGNSVRLANRLFSFIAGRNTNNEMQAFNHFSERYYRFQADEPVWVALVGTDIVFSLQELPLISGIERLSRPPESMEHGSLMPLLAGLPEDAVVRGVTGEEGTAIADLLGTLSPEIGALLRPLLEETAEATLWLDLESADRLVGELHTYGDAAAPSGTTMELVVPGMALKLRLQSLPAPGDGQRAWRLEAEGVVASIIGALQDLERRDRE